jgi:hypothetical protein
MYRETTNGSSSEGDRGHVVLLGICGGRREGKKKEEKERMKKKERMKENEGEE